ncbi:amidohydrolase [Paenibacillus spiritus]|uniref:Amidohydrolase n=1 Tax=Paenibacillus spiritus TaxID=2496557 RepID=A0A5J5G8P9_9BACL|nr:amidohydrolase [Paenibacillus spiritus]KAA9004200.1 amidohydrolase [Paenibacillus spiritus]
MESIDLLITHANVLTMDESNRIAGSLAVTNGRISAIWYHPEPPYHEVNVTSRTKILNLKGATLIPGFIETHNHLLQCGYIKGSIDCGILRIKTISGLLRDIEEKAATTPAGQWIQGFGYDDTLLEDMRHPTRFDLDKVSPDHPVFITHISGHLGVANSKALELAGIDDCTAGSKANFEQNDKGELNGVLYESHAMGLVQRVIPMLDEATFIKQLGEAAQDYIAQGITTNTDAAIPDLTTLNIMLKAAELGLLPMRMQLMIMHGLLTSKGAYAGYDAKRLDDEIRSRSNGQARLDSAKMFQDGSIQGLTGALREPYYCNDNLRGELFHEQTAFNEEVADLHKRGFRIAIHGNGDRAIGSILDAYEYALTIDPRVDHRHRIEHVQTATNEDLDRMQQLGVAGSFFINHVYYWGERHDRIFLGPERAKRISPLRDALDRRLLFTLHSDCPITPISPLFLIWAAVNRMTTEGRTLGPDQKIDALSALKAMTIEGAKLNFQEKEVGSIEVGKWADFAVLDEDPLRVNPLDIKDISVLYTIVGGQIKYENVKIKV